MESNKFENPEPNFDRLIEDLAEREEMSPDDIRSDFITFAEIAEEDPDALAYFEIIAEKINVTTQQVVEYAKGLAK